MKNYYEILEISRDADDVQIKTAYYNLARKYHPDKVGDFYRDKFEQINEAYKILSDKIKRLAFDMELARQPKKENNTVLNEKTEKSPLPSDVKLGIETELLSQIETYEEILLAFAESGYISNSRELAPASIKALIRKNRLSRNK